MLSRWKPNHAMILKGGATFGKGKTALCSTSRLISISYIYMKVEQYHCIIYRVKYSQSRLSSPFFQNDNLSFKMNLLSFEISFLLLLILILLLILNFMKCNAHFPIICWMDFKVLEVVMLFRCDLWEWTLP